MMPAYSAFDSDDDFVSTLATNRSTPLGTSYD
ncbi:hypothetical protein ACVIHH_003799 [Bradyrhizobium sp. USDA 4518]|nr:hypothetical protein [Bradyrhizobium sp. USDA 4541]MCP1914422.1 hypothetical protein [Bradyrhizobium elkanii]